MRLCLAGMTGRVLLALAAVLVLLTGARAHDHWANGMEIPAWVKSACCGPSDAHLLDLDDVAEIGGGSWRIKGIDTPVLPDHVFPSQDGSIWAFYSPAAGRNAFVYCLFLPLAY